MIVVAIPTYRRPDSLAVLLASVSEALTVSRRARDEGVLVLVGDNACDPGTPGVVAEHLNGPPSRVLPVPTPGVSAVREALCEAALAESAATWVVMLDDDGEVLPPWLDELLDVADASEFDVVGGPVLGDLPDGASALARASLFGGRLRPPTGEVAMLNGAQNIAVRRSLLEEMPRPWFDPALGLGGGEDIEFFAHARALGARLGWSDTAAVVEPTPPERLTTRAILTRVVGSNRVGTHVLHLHGGWRETLGVTARQGLWLVKSAGAGIVRREPARFHDVVLKGAGLAGRLRAIAELAVGAGPDLARGRRRVSGPGARGSGGRRRGRRRAS